MNKLRLFALVSSASLLATVGVAACSSDDVVIADFDAGGDASGDAAGGDATPDVVTDASSDGGLDSSPDFDANVDAGVDGSTVSPVVNFALQVAETLCDSLTRCCYGNPSVPSGTYIDAGNGDGGFFNRANCLNAYRTLGFENSDVDALTSVDGGFASTDGVTLDPTQAADCLSKVQSLACNLDGPTLSTIRTACFAALSGQLADGQPCAKSIQCGTSSFCKPTSSSGGAGTCTPLLAQGDNCSVQQTSDSNADAVIADDACSNRSSGSSGLHCAYFDNGATTTDSNFLKADRSAWTCQPNVGLGETCYGTYWCASSVCDPLAHLTCVSSETYFNSAVCAYELK